MRKILLLMRTMRKCGGGEEAQSRTSMVVSAVMLVILGLIFAAFMWFMGRQFGEVPEKMIAQYGGAENVLSALMLFSLVLSVILCVRKSVDQLFMSADIESIITLPFSGTDILMASFLDIVRQPILWFAVPCLPFMIGYSTAVHAPALAYVCAVLGVFCLGIASSAIICAVVILLMSFFRVFRSRDTLKKVGSAFGILMLLLFLGRRYLINDADGEQTKSLLAFAGEIARAFPAFPLAIRAVLESDVLALLGCLAICAVSFALFLIVGKFFYLSAALSMQSAGSSAQAMGKEEMERSATRTSPALSYLRKELKIIFRTPELMMDGWLRPLLLPVLMGVLYFGKLKDVLKMAEALSEVQLAVGLACACGLITTFCVMSGNLGLTSVSREGASFLFVRQFPLPMRKQIHAKRNAVLLISALGGMLIPIAAAVAMAVTGAVPAAYIPFAVVVCASLLLLEVDIQMIIGMKRADLVWENLKNVTSRFGLTVLLLLLGGIAVILAVSAGLIFLMAKWPLNPYVMLAILDIIVILAAVLVDQRMNRISDTALDNL